MSVTTLPPSTRTAMLQAFMDKLIGSAVSDKPKIMIRGTQNGSTATLVTIELANITHSIDSLGILTISSTDLGTAERAGTATEAKLINSNNVVVLTTEVGAGKPITMPVYDLDVGSTVSISGITIALGN